jgi:hypothetical protein
MWVGKDKQTSQAAGGGGPNTQRLAIQAPRAIYRCSTVRYGTVLRRSKHSTAQEQKCAQNPTITPADGVCSQILVDFDAWKQQNIVDSRSPAVPHGWTSGAEALCPGCSYS